MIHFTLHITEREQQVLNLISYGWNNTQISSSLYISTHTVVSYRKSLLRKFKVNNCAALIRMAFEKELLFSDASVSFAPVKRAAS